METMRVELVEGKKKKVNWLQAVPTIITAVVAVAGIVFSALTYQSTNEDRAAQRIAADEDRAAQRLADKNNRFTYAIEHLKDESMAIRLGALYELENICLDSEDEAKKIVSILTPFFREHVEDKEGKWLLQPDGYSFTSSQKRIDQDVYLVGSILSEAFLRYDVRANLSWLTVENLNLSDLQLKGADLSCANFCGATLNGVQFDGAKLYETCLDATWVNTASFKGATLTGTSFIGIGEIWPLSIDTLLEANTISMIQLDDNFSIDGDELRALQGLYSETNEILWSKGLLSPELRDYYDRLMAGLIE